MYGVDIMDLSIVKSVIIQEYNILSIDNFFLKMNISTVSYNYLWKHEINAKFATQFWCPTIQQNNNKTAYTFRAVSTWDWNVKTSDLMKVGSTHG